MYDTWVFYHSYLPFSKPLPVDQYSVGISAVSGRKNFFYLTTHSTHFIYGYMASDIWYRTTQIVREKTRCRHIGCSYRLAARVLLYASSHRQDNTYHGLCYIRYAVLVGTRNSSIGLPQRIDPTTHRTLSKHSYHGATWFIEPLPLDQYNLGISNGKREYYTRTRWRRFILQWVVSKTYLMSKSMLDTFGNKKSPSIFFPQTYVSRSSQCSATGVTTAVVCSILSVGWCI